MSIARYGLNSQGVFVSMADGGYASYQDYEKLAAENAGLKSAIDATIGWQQSTDSENVESVRMLLEIKTPATDAFLAEVRASELDSLAGVAETMLVKFSNQRCSSDMHEVVGWKMVHQQASNRAAQLRQEAAQ